MPADQITVTLPDGSSVTVPPGTTPAEIGARFAPAAAADAVAARVDGTLVDLTRPLHADAKVEFVAASSTEGREVLRHSTAHLLAQAVFDLFPGARYAIGPAISDGFYYDFELPDGRHFTDEDLGRIEARMRELVAEDQPFVREEIDLSAGRALFADQPYKLEIIDRVAGGDADEEDRHDFAGGSTVTVYRNVRPDGTEAYCDLCTGPHVPSTGRLGAFRLQRVAGAYWRGDERGPQLQRVYGTAWESPEALAEHLERLEEAARRDHRHLGVALDLYSFPPEIGSGLAVFHPRGATLRAVMEDDSRRRHAVAGYEFVYSPHITKRALFETSGHLEWFAEGMFPPMELDGGTEYYLKPMNCPFHILIYRSRIRSYRELPLRFFELGTVYRYEKSGVVHGLTRVRGMTQDDAHIFCTREQMRDEIRSILDFVLEVLRDYGLDDFHLELSTRPEGKAVGRDDEWEEATDALAAVAEAVGLDLHLDEGGGAFYGPKISVQTRDAIGRSWQISTVQLDFQLPQRFDLHYVGADNERHRPIMIHRALFGSVERFLAILVEHYAGAFPLWLAPVQVVVTGVADRHDPYAFRVVDRLRAEGFRAELVPAHGESLGARIRRAKGDKVPYVCVVGDADAEAGTLGVNRRAAERPERDVPVDEFVERLRAERLERAAAPGGS
jgi:threonyl-tRNA synthetase